MEYNIITILDTNLKNGSTKNYTEVIELGIKNKLTTSIQTLFEIITYWILITHNTLAVFILLIHPVNTQNVITKIESFKPSLLV